MWNWRFFILPPDPMAEPIMLSALQHYSYCPRQCALIHQEQSFDDNEYTLRGQRAHRRVDSGEISTEDGRQVLRALPLYSDRLGLVGKADVVEFLPDGTPIRWNTSRVSDTNTITMTFSSPHRPCVWKK